MNIEFEKKKKVGKLKLYDAHNNLIALSFCQVNAVQLSQYSWSHSFYSSRIHCETRALFVLLVQFQLATIFQILYCSFACSGSAIRCSLGLARGSPYLLLHSMTPFRILAWIFTSKWTIPGSTYRHNDRNMSSAISDLFDSLRYLRIAIPQIVWTRPISSLKLNSLKSFTATHVTGSMIEL